MPVCQQAMLLLPLLLLGLELLLLLGLLHLKGREEVCLEVVGAAAAPGGMAPAAAGR